MAAVKPITDRERSKVLADIDAGMHRNDLARKYKRSPSTITKIANEGGRSFDRTKTAAAAQAFKDDMALRRAKLADDLLSDAEYFRTRLRQKHQAWVGTPDGPEMVELDEPPLPELRQGVVAVTTAIAGHAKLLDMDKADGDKASTSLLAGLAQAMGIEYKP